MRKALAIAFLLCAAAMLPAQSGEPFLRVEIGMHTAKIRRISADAAGRMVLTCSNDKTARLWDADSGELLRVFRPPIGAGNEGMLYSCAISPDGATVALGGWTGDEWDGSNSVYLFNAATGAMFRRLGGFPNVIFDIEFSPDGSFLALALGGANGARVFSTRSWQELAKLEGYNGDIYSLAFRPGGGLATVCFDGKLRLYDGGFALERECSFTHAGQPFSLAFSPDGTRLAVGFYDSPHVQMLDTANLKPLYEPDISGADQLGDKLEVLCFSRDGKRLYAGGFYNVLQGNTWKHAIRCWAKAGKGEYTDFPVAVNSIMDLKAMDDGSVLFAGSSPDWGRLAADGTLILYKSADTNNYRAKDTSHLRVSSRADEVGFTPFGCTPQRFLLARRTLLREQSHAAAYTDTLGKASVSDWYNSFTPRLNGRDLKFLKQYETCFSVDICDTGERTVFGAAWTLYCLDKGGNGVWEEPTQAGAFAVNIAGDGRSVVAALDDGSIRWYRMSDGELLLTLFAHPDGKRWIVYTPDGFYDCAPGSEDLIGWHVNNGRDHEAYFYPVSRFRNTFYRPDVIARILDTLDEAEALRLADSDANRKPAGTSIAGKYPPIIQIVSPTDGAGFSTPELNLSYRISNYAGDPITGMKVLIDGRPTDIQKGLVNTDETGTLKLSLPRRNVRVGLVAENKYGSSEVCEISLVWQGKDAETELKPNLYILAVGINAYPSKGLKLNYSAKDARDFVTVLQAQQGKMYNRVEARLLLDGDADAEGIRDGLEWILKQTTSKDVAMIFLSGHGISSNFNQFYYLPVNADPDRPLATCLPFSDITNTAERVAGNVVVFVDACHSGLIYDSKRKAPDAYGMANIFADVTGASIFMSCSPEQYSLESDKWQNGAFTKALVEGLSGRADTLNKGYVTVAGLLYYIAERVKELTDNAQTPILGNKDNLNDFRISWSK